MGGLKRHSGAISNLYFLPSRFNSKVPTADCRGEERVELLAESLVFDPGDCGFAATHKSDHHETHGTGVSLGHEERRTAGEQLRGSAEPGIFSV